MFSFKFSLAYNVPDSNLKNLKKKKKMKTDDIFYKYLTKVCSSFNLSQDNSPINIEELYYDCFTYIQIDPSCSLSDTYNPVLCHY